MKLGDRVIRTPQTLGEYDPSVETPALYPLTGQVEYIHPAGRYHVVAFPTPGGTVRESFPGVRY